MLIINNLIFNDTVQAMSMGTYTLLSHLIPAILSSFEKLPLALGNYLNLTSCNHDGSLFINGINLGRYPGSPLHSVCTAGIRVIRVIEMRYDREIYQTSSLNRNEIPAEFVLAGAENQLFRS